MTEALLLNCIHAEPAGQQKFAWEPVRWHDCQPETAQESDCGSACLSTKPTGCAGERDAESAVTAGSVIDIKHTAKSFGEAVQTMVGMCLHKTVRLVFSRNVRIFLKDRLAAGVGRKSS